MRTWMLLLGGLLIWAAHFFALYSISEFAEAGGRASMAVLGVTALALGGVALVALRSWRRSPSDDLGNWSTRLGRSALLLSALAIVWQSFPALFS